ncbi:MAG TPA: division/cell wall cluster transcriptional repressor MraZ [Burkholderiales bacterium]|nr:division/cell wall cluster transcriptional repressor MraZ [Burkholderiales bacterium]
MFRGVALLSLDSKNRLAIPVKFRDAILARSAGQLILTADPHGCLLLYPKPDWEPIAQKLMGLSSFEPRSRHYQRLIVGHAEDIEMDGAGRILVSPVLRKFAAIDKRVSLVGQGNKFELWDEAQWDKQREDALAYNNAPLTGELEGFSL